jgi:hypothetical protein
MSINWLQRVQVQDVSETKKWKMARMGRDWGEVISRGDVRFEECAGGL